ncbi:MAG TPA: choice-of-anchor L domain-containing protein [Polyangiaceae bacterium]|jgi:hypothetical protein
MRPLAFVATTLAVVAVACSSGNGNFDGGTAEDSGGGVDSSPTTDSGKPETGPLFDSGFVLDSSSGNDATTDESGSQYDATFDFDGFSKGDGNNCFDDDGDGWTTCDGDCNDHDSLINPCAFDTNDPSDPVGSDGIDNDCDGQIDNLRTCDASLTAGHSTKPGDYASAMDICDNAKCSVVVGATFYGPNDSFAHRITAHMGQNFTPHKGSYMAFLSTGTADDDKDNPSYTPGDGTNLQNTFPNPAPLKAAQNPNPCNPNGTDEPTTVNDYSEIRLTLRAPINAGSFTFDFNFFSEEYPEYVCHGFNDTFLAMLTSQQYNAPTQIAFDGLGHRINVNNGFFQDCNDVTSGLNLGYTHLTCSNPLSTLAQTGYEIKYGQTAFTLGNDNLGSGATDWLKTTAPIAPGETFTLSFIIYDEGDGLMDSAINLDNFRWHSTTISSPVTAR